MTYLAFAVGAALLAAYSPDALLVLGAVGVIGMLAGWIIERAEIRKEVERIRRMNGET